MSVRNLECLIDPKSVALIGASDRPQSVGAVTACNLLGSGFEGRVMLVNPKHEVIQGVVVYADVESLPVAPDLAVICTPPATVPGIVRALARRGTKAAVVITAGLGLQPSPGEASLRQQMLDAARPGLMRVLGPNCVGLMVPGIGLNASFAHRSPIKGGIAFVTQSGAMATTVLDWATARGIGFSHLVSLGDMGDVDFGDMLDYLAADPRTKAVLLYVEAITQARKFMSAARACSRLKPLIVIKSGRHAEGARAAASHSGALAGSDAVYDAAFRRAGALRVFQMQELFDAVETLATGRGIEGERLAILTNGGGPGVLAVDALIDAGGQCAVLAESTKAALDAVLPPTWSGGNPVDIIGDAPGERFGKTLDILLRDPGNDAVLVLNCPTAVASGTDAARATIDAARASRRPVLASWLGEDAVAEARGMFAEHRIPSYATPEQAVAGFMHLVRHRQNQALLVQAPSSAPLDFVIDLAAVKAMLDKALAEGREWLSAAEAAAVFAAYGIPIVETVNVRTPEEAASAAGRIGRPVAVKILSPDLTHKSDVGGVALDLATPEAALAAAADMVARISRSHPQARLEGFTIQPMVDRAHVHELIVGMASDRQFGPVLMVGQGGTGVEVIDDKSLALPPLNLMLAHEMLSRTRVFRLLRGFRDRPAAALGEIAQALVKISHLIADHADIAELDINPLLADEKGVIALDGRIRVIRSGQPGAARMAICPYPRELEQTIVLRTGRTVFSRPVRPEDHRPLQAFIAGQDPEDVRLRFFSRMRGLTDPMAARLTQIDYDREMALVALEDRYGQDLLGVVRLICDPDSERAEFAAMVRSDLKGQGLGYALMERLIGYARSRGVGTVFGEILVDNRAMLQMCQALGFVLDRSGPDRGVVLGELFLR